MSLALARPLETQLYAVINHHPPHFYKVIKCHFESIAHVRTHVSMDHISSRDFLTRKWKVPTSNSRLRKRKASESMHNFLQTNTWIY